MVSSFMTASPAVVLFWLGCIICCVASAGEESGQSMAITVATSELEAVTALWKKEHSVECFPKSLHAMRALAAHRGPDPVAETLLGDFAAWMFANSEAGLEFGDDAGVVRSCQMEAVSTLCDRSFVAYHREMAGWAAARSRRLRILMLARARWEGLRDQHWDGKPIQLDSTVGGIPDPLFKERNEKAALQMQLRTIATEEYPAIDAFTLEAALAESCDVRELAELLALGRHTHAETTAILVAVANGAKQAIPPYLTP